MHSLKVHDSRQSSFHSWNRIIFSPWKHSFVISNIKQYMISFMLHRCWWYSTLVHRHHIASLLLPSRLISCTLCTCTCSWQRTCSWRRTRSWCWCRCSCSYFSTGTKSAFSDLDIRCTDVIVQCFAQDGVAFIIFFDLIIIEYSMSTQWVLLHEFFSMSTPGRRAWYAPSSRTRPLTHKNLSSLLYSLTDIKATPWLTTKYQSKRSQTPTRSRWSLSS